MEKMIELPNRPAWALDNMAAAPISMKDKCLKSSPYPGRGDSISRVSVSNVLSRFDIPVPPLTRIMSAPAFFAARTAFAIKVESSGVIS